MRPALLVAEREPENGLSTRKLLLETAKFNVITAHTCGEAMEAVQTFGKGLAGAVVTSHLGPQSDCDKVAKMFKEAKPFGPVILLSPSGMDQSRYADHSLSTYEPDALLKLVRELFGDPSREP